jgi:predicted GNAT family N-acyltransferase
MLSKTVKEFIRKDIHKMSNLPGISAGWVTSKTDLSDIYKLRYNVMVRDVKQNLFPSNHYCIQGDEFRDTYDELPSTSHYLIRKNGKAVAAHRLINGNQTAFEIEKYKWFNNWFPLNELHRRHENPNNVVEPTRVVACRSIRGQHYAPLMLTAALMKIHDDKYESVLGLVNAESVQLIAHYQKFMPNLTQISREKFAVSEFVAGRHSHALNLYIGTTEKERDAFIYRTIMPCMTLCKYLYFTKKN